MRKIVCKTVVFFACTFLCFVALGCGGGGGGGGISYGHGQSGSFANTGRVDNFSIGFNKENGIPIQQSDGLKNIEWKNITLTLYKNDVPTVYTINETTTLSINAPISTKLYATAVITAADGTTYNAESDTVFAGSGKTKLTLYMEYKLTFAIPTFHFGDASKITLPSPNPQTYTKRGKTLPTATWTPAPGETTEMLLEGWYFDDALTNKCTTLAGVTGNKTLYPKFVPDVMHTITYSFPSGANAYTDYEKSKIDFSACPSQFSERKGVTLVDATSSSSAPVMTFEGWYFDENFTNKCTTLVGKTGNVTLYPKFTRGEIVYTVSNYDDFNGTDNPFKISTPSHLVQMQNLMKDSNKNFSGKKIVLVNDIDMSGVTGFTGLGKGNSAHTFNGTFDGNGKKVTVAISSTGSTASIGFINALGNGGSVSNLCLLGSISVTGVTATCGGIVGVNYGTISNCINRARIEGSASTVGGIAGENDMDGTIRACANLGEVKVTSGSPFVGGICGSNYGMVKHVYNTGKVSAPTTGSSFAGGLVGYNESTLQGGYAQLAAGFLQGLTTDGICAENNYLGTITDVFILDSNYTSSHTSSGLPQAQATLLASPYDAYWYDGGVNWPPQLLNMP